MSCCGPIYLSEPVYRPQETASCRLKVASIQSSKDCLFFHQNYIYCINKTCPMLCQSKVLLRQYAEHSCKDEPTLTIWEIKVPLNHYPLATQRKTDMTFLNCNWFTLTVEKRSEHSFFLTLWQSLIAHVSNTNCCLSALLCQHHSPCNTEPSASNY